MTKIKLQDQLFYLILSTIYCWSVGCAVSSFALLPASSLQLFEISFVVSFIGLASLWNLYTKLIGGGIVIILLLFFPIGKLVISCFSGLIFGQALQNDQMWMLTFVIMIVLSLFTILSLKHKLNFYLLTILGIVLYLIAVTQGNINTVALFGFLFVITVLLISNNFVKKHGSKDGFGSYVLHGAPVAVIAVICTVLIVTPFSDLLGNARGLFEYESIRDWIDQEILGGFSEQIPFEEQEENLLSSFPSEEQPLLKVATEQEYMDLYGGISDVYTGHSWQKSNIQQGEFEKDDQTVDIASLKSIQASDFNTDSIHADTIKIQYLLESDRLFVPRLSGTFDQVGRRDIYENQMGEFLLSSPLKRNDTMAVTYYQEHLQEMYGRRNLSSALDRYQIEQITVNQVFNHQDLTHYDSWNQENLNGYEASIQQQYTQLSSSVTKRTMDLAKQITSGIKQDSEKAEAICDYLIEHYTYTLHPSDPEEGQDFVDHFLFEEKQGYSNSFASAMVILSRSVGLPARYVTGYHMPVASSEEEHIIRLRNYHSWAEVYLPGYGWCKFEATPPYAYQEAIASEKPNITITSDGGEEMESHLADLGLSIAQTQPVESEKSTIPIWQDGVAPSDTPAGNQDQQQQQSTTQNQNNTSALVPLPIWIFIGMIILIVLLLLVRYRIRISKEQKAVQGTPEQLAQFSFTCLVRLGKYIGVEIQQDETPVSFTRRLAAKYPTLAKELCQAGQLYSQCIYSKTKTTEEDARKLYNSYHLFETRIRLEQKRFGFFWNKYIAHRI